MISYKKIHVLVSTLAILSFSGLASAHVVVTPDKVGIGKETIFSISVPNEQGTPVVSVKLLIPDGVTNVVPTEKSGWTTQITQSSDKDPKISSISWSSGSIPIGQRDDFTFSAQVPGSPTSLNWKAFQTYGDGTTVHWDQVPNGKDDSTVDAGPYSTTLVVDDLSNAASTNSSSTNNNVAIIALIIGLIALAISVINALYRRK